MLFAPLSPGLGVEVDTQGDAFFAAFARASDAVAAAAEIRDSLGDGPVRVRVGIHTGEPLVTQEGYVGLDVHRAARIAAAAHGGQVVLSRTTRDLLGRFLGLRDLGEHRLKDLIEAERLFQFGDGDFPPLRTLDATNLPVAAEPAPRTRARSGRTRRAARRSTARHGHGAGRHRQDAARPSGRGGARRHGLRWCLLGCPRPAHRPGSRVERDRAGDRRTRRSGRLSAWPRARAATRQLRTPPRRCSDGRRAHGHSRGPARARDEPGAAAHLGRGRVSTRPARSDRRGRALRRACTSSRPGHRAGRHGRSDLHRDSTACRWRSSSRPLVCGSSLPGRCSHGSNGRCPS